MRAFGALPGRMDQQFSVAGQTSTSCADADRAEKSRGPRLISSAGQIESEPQPDTERLTMTAGEIEVRLRTGTSARLRRRSVSCPARANSDLVDHNDAHARSDQSARAGSSFDGQPGDAPRGTHTKSDVAEELRRRAEDDSSKRWRTASRKKTIRSIRSRRSPNQLQLIVPYDSCRTNAIDLVTRTSFLASSRPDAEPFEAYRRADGTRGLSRRKIVTNSCTTQVRRRPSTTLVSRPFRVSDLGP